MNDVFPLPVLPETIRIEHFDLSDDEMISLHCFNAVFLPTNFSEALSAKASCDVPSVTSEVSCVEKASSLQSIISTRGTQWNIECDTPMHKPFADSYSVLKSIYYS